MGEGRGRQGLSWLELATLTSQEPEAEGFQVPSYGTHFCLAVSSPTLEGISKIITLMFEMMFSLELR